MALRQDLVEGTDVPTFEEAITVFDDLDKMGAAAEAWKFGLAVLARYRARPDTTCPRGSS